MRNDPASPNRPLTGPAAATSRTADQRSARDESAHVVDVCVAVAFSSSPIAMQRFVLSGAVHAMRNAAIARAAATRAAASRISAGHSAATAATASALRGARPFSAAAASSAPASSAASTSASPILSSLPPELQALALGVLSGDRLSLSRAITLVESSHPKHIGQAQQLLDALAKERQRRRRAEAAATSAHSSTSSSSAATPASPALSKADADALALRRPRSLRIGISGPPGVGQFEPHTQTLIAGDVWCTRVLMRLIRDLTLVGCCCVRSTGKSTFIECLGQYLLGLGHRLAVLSIDPSSHLTGGSILGDKTRMLELSRNENAYVRPSPSKCVLGGVGAHTFDAILLAEHAGFNTILIETVGVGQSEVSVSDMCDLLLLLVQPGGGDELQGMKKGIVELIDLIVVNKADGALEANARHTKLEYMHALQLNTRRKAETDWKPQVKLCSSVQETAGNIDTAAPAETAAAIGTAGIESSATSASASGVLSARERQRAQLQDIWRTIGAFDDWSKGPFGDFHLRRARQAKALLQQAVRENAFVRITHALQSIQAFQGVQGKLDRQAERAGRAEEDGDAVEADAEVEVIPRVAAQKIVDEWILQEAEHVRAQNDSASSTISGTSAGSRS